MAPSTPSLLSAAETRELLPMGELIEAVGRAFDARSSAPQRLVLADEGQDWIVMPALVPGGGMLCKLLRVGHTASAGQPTIAGVVTLFGADGRLIAALDGGALTARRTAAIAGYATGLLARPDASVLALFGVGGLAADHLEAIAAVRPLASVRVVGRSPRRAEEFCDRMAARGYPVTMSDAGAALAGATIVVTVTTSAEPVFADGDLEAGAHVNAMGSYRPERAEVPAATVVRARVVVETRETAWHEAGDLIGPLRQGLIGDDHVRAELGEREAVAALRPAEPDAVTLFKSVGHVALDLAALGLAQARLEAGTGAAGAPA